MQYKLVIRLLSKFNSLLRIFILLIVCESSHPLRPVFGSYPTGFGPGAIRIEIPVPLQEP
jgi:hypothetical protein